MKMKLATVSLVALLLISGGTLTLKYLGDRGQDNILGPPEGYEEPEGRVEKLKIDGSVSKYYDENLDLVAFGPGSGWLKFKTRDGISPTISFNRVSQKDVKKFNRFSKSIGLPIKVEFTNNVLRLSSDEVSEDPVYMADITEEKIGKNSIMTKGFFNNVEEPTRLVIRKDRSGKVFLVKADSPENAPGDSPGTKKLFVAQKEKTTATD